MIVTRLQHLTIHRPLPCYCLFIPLLLLSPYTRMLSLAVLFFTAATVYASTLNQASNFPVSPEVAAQYGCGRTCQRHLNQTNAMDLEDFNIPFDFLSS